MSISSEEDITGTSNTGPPKMKTEKGLQETRTRSFDIPHGFTENKKEFEGPFSHSNLKDGKELWLFRLPSFFPISALDNVEIPLGKKSLQDSLVTIPLSTDKSSSSSSLSSSSSFKFDISAIDFSNNYKKILLEHRDISQFIPLLPEKGNKTLLSPALNGISKYFSVTPKIPIPSSKEIELKGQAILKQLPKTHTQPLKMKSQFQPYGSEIDPSQLERNLERHILMNNIISSEDNVVIKKENELIKEKEKSPKKIKKSKSSSNSTTTTTTDTPTTHSPEKKKRKKHASIESESNQETRKKNKSIKN